ALSHQRRLRAPRQAEHLWLDIPLRGPGVDLRDARRPVLPLSIPESSSPRTGAELRGGGRARGAPRHRRDDSSDGNPETHPRHRRHARRAIAAYRRDGDALSYGACSARPELPGLRYARDPRADRLRRVLWNTWRRDAGEK